MNHYAVSLTSHAHEDASSHLLGHYQAQRCQEDLCFALWRPSTGKFGISALIDEVILPKENERQLHGNVSFTSSYLVRAIAEARQKNAGLVFMHSHPSDGWQEMSRDDIIAEQDVISRPAGVTGFPLVGMTIGTDEAWSARFWLESKRYSDSPQMQKCDRVKVVGESFSITYDDKLTPLQHEHDERLKRTLDVWGTEMQKKLARLRFGIVGLGSVGSIVAESLARIGMGNITLIDPDKMKPHNLDRTLYATRQDVGKKKVNVVASFLRKNKTFDGLNLREISTNVDTEIGYKAAVDCDILFACVDNHSARAILNRIAYAHLIPVIEGGINAEFKQPTSVHWKSHIIAPGYQCLRCNGQYSINGLSEEQHGISDSSQNKYIQSTSPIEEGGQNVFAFSLNLASMEVLHMLRYVLSLPTIGRKRFQFVFGKSTTLSNLPCETNCEFPQIVALGDAQFPKYHITQQKASSIRRFWRKILSMLRLIVSFIPQKSARDGKRENRRRG